MHIVRSEPSSVLLRRKHVRIVPSGHLKVSIVNSPLPVELHDLSLGGFALTASRPFPIGLTHRFLFATSSGVEVTLVAKAIHCYSRLVDGVQSFVTGWEFMAGSAELTEAALAQLMDAATA